MRSPTPHTGPPATAPRPAYALLAALASLVLLIVFCRTSFAEPRFWAEDGAIFFNQWRELGIRSFLQPYAGYSHLQPRLIAATASFLPLKWTAAFYLWASAAITAWTAYTIARCVPGWVGVFLALALVFAYGGEEVLANPTNLQWVTATGLAIIAAAQFQPAWINRLLFAFCAGLTGPFSTFLAPLFIIRGALAIKAKQFQELPISAVVILTGAVQAYLVLTTSKTAGFSVDGFGYVVVRLYQLAHGPSGIAALVAVPVTLAGFTIGEHRWFRRTLFAAALIVVVFTAAKFSVQSRVFESGTGGLRYWYIPSALALIFYISMLVETRRWMNGLGLIGLLVMAIGADYSSTRRKQPAALMSWSDAVAQAEMSGASVTYRFPPGWAVTIP